MLEISNQDVCKTGVSLEKYVPKRTLGTRKKKKKIEIYIGGHMLSFEKLVQQYNEKVEISYGQTLENIKIIWEKLKDDEEKHGKYLFAIADKILSFAELEQELSEEYYQNNSLEYLQKTNSEFFDEIIPQNYEYSYANPEYSVKIFGAEMGAMLASYYISYRSYLPYAFQHQRYQMEKWNNLYIRVCELFQTSDFKVEILQKLITSIYANPTKDDSITSLSLNYHKETDYVKNIVMKADLNDIRYLYQYGKNITENELKSAEFLNNYPPEKIEILAKAISKSFVRGYELARKDISQKNSIGVYYHLGQERIVRSLVFELENIGLTPILSMVFTTHPNKQYQYDHRFNNSLFLDENFVELLKEKQQVAAEECGDFLQTYAGPIYFDSFGEKPFAPQAKAECLKLNKEQQKMSQMQRINYTQIIDKYMSRSKTSFCIVGFPLPEIGKDFEAIFEDTMAINMMDTIKHEQIQQHIVDALDRADNVHVKGKDGNQTDIIVKMHKLSDPSKQTNFVNCGADVNVPVGEVFTSPVLKGTNGVLHLKESFLKGLKFTELKLTFKDGYVEKYDCKNFEKEEDNKKFIEENLLFPHKTLPIGEFAIGTNTKAYIMAQKYDILSVMPVLIVEKMGPHFAIGDTCFSWEEDFAVYNPIDNKEITARENEHSALRKTDVSKAYTNCHTDITLPYEDLDFISAVTVEGEKIDIILNGRFVVPGTEELNIPLDE